MADRMAVVFMDNDLESFECPENKPYEQIQQWMEDGEVIEVRMPTPTRRNPLKFRMVYKYMGRRPLHKIRDESATMGPRVIEQAMQGSSRHKAIVKAWRPHFIISIQVECLA